MGLDGYGDVSHAVKTSKVTTDGGQSCEQRQCEVGLCNSRSEGIQQDTPLWA